jgi:hypothetical protein
MVSTDVVNTIIGVMTAEPDNFVKKIEDSKTSHDTMDALIHETYDLTAIDLEFLKAESVDTLEKMLRSQQSKKSRSKSKVMTMENYKTMLVGAVAENLLRMAINKPKSSGGGGYRASEVTYSEDELKAYANDQELLKKEIRNIQSKKSIAKSKADFDEKSERWQQLLVAEEQLKALRTGTSTVVDTKAIEVKEKTTELLKDIDLDHMKGADAKSILAQIAATLNQ